jgi:DNA-binding response OmpR family regulator
MRLIIAEDEPLLAICISDTVQAAGHEVVCCVASADRALACARQKRADLALVNISLNEGDTAGVDLARALNALDIPSIFVSGQRIDAMTGREFAIGYLPKPYSPEGVLQSIAVAQVVMQGGTPPPPPLPSGLELF